MRMRVNKRAIDKIYRRRDRYEIPEWQRQEVWSRSKKQNLIDSILRGWKLPKFYFLKISDDRESCEVVDGQQRLVTIFEFFENEFPLAEEAAKRFGGKFYKDLPDKFVDAFDDYEIEFDEIEDASDEEVKQFFQRLQDGLPLTTSEKLNSIHSKLRDFVMRLTKHPFFARIAASDRRYGHFDILAKVAAIEIDGIDVALRYDDLRAVFESQAVFSSQSNVAKRISSALDFADQGFGEDVLLLRNRTVVQSLLSLVCRLMQSPNVTGQERRVAQFFVEFLKELSRQVELGQQATDADYLDFQRTINANVKSGARIRQQILLRKLLAFDPAFVDMLDGAAVAESGLRAAIAKDVGEIVRRIGELNEQYAATHGENLFKPTNRTAQAQARIGIPVKDLDDYKSLVDDLYFLTREAVGNRLQARIPGSFEHINILRTDLQHDVEHGDKRKTRAKKLKTGSVFSSYSGAPSPAGLAPDRFVIVQANLLASLRRDLNAIHV